MVGISRLQSQEIRQEVVEEYHMSPPPITHLGAVDNFVQSIIAGKTNALPGEEGMKTTVVLEAAYRSSEEGRAIALS